MSNKVPQKMISGFPVFVLQLMDIGFYNSGFNKSTIRVLYEIYNNIGCTASSIAKKLNVHRTLVGKIVSFLEKEQFLSNKSLRRALAEYRGDAEHPKEEN